MPEATTERGAYADAVRITRQVFVTKDSGAREDFPTGSRRDTNEGKPRYDLIPVTALKRLAALYARGAEKYEEFNWAKGQPLRRYEESALRHIYQYLEGDREEDHLAACCWNLFSIMHHEKAIAEGRLPAELDNRSERL